MIVVRCCLEVPRDPPRIRIDCYYRSRVETVFTLFVWMRRPSLRNAVAGSEVIEIQIGIVSTREPREASAFEHGFGIRPCFRSGLAWIGSYPPFPLQCAGFRIV